MRHFKIADKDQLIEIFKMNIPEYFDPAELNHFRQYLSQHADSYVTIEHEGKIAGGIGYCVNESDKSGRITWIFFHPNTRGIGLGRKAVEYCMRILQADPIVKTLVIQTSQLAFHFFEKFGYKLVKTEKDYWGKGLDLYLMEQPVF